MVRTSLVGSDHDRLLRVTLSFDLSFDRHISIVSAPSSYWYVNCGLMAVTGHGFCGDTRALGRVTRWLLQSLLA